jgi:hypothetical protein
MPLRAGAFRKLRLATFRNGAPVENLGLITTVHVYIFSQKEKGMSNQSMRDCGT